MAASEILWPVTQSATVVPITSAAVHSRIVDFLVLSSRGITDSTIKRHRSSRKHDCAVLWRGYLWAGKQPYFPPHPKN